MKTAIEFEECPALDPKFEAFEIKWDIRPDTQNQAVRVFFGGPRDPCGKCKLDCLAARGAVSGRCRCCGELVCEVPTYTRENATYELVQNSRGERTYFRRIEKDGRRG